MTQEEFEYNKTVAKFLGWEYIDKDSHAQAYQNYGWWIKNTYYNDIDARDNENFKGFNSNLKFHSDWNCIMKIIQKIESLYFTVNISSSMVYINGAKGIVVLPINIYEELGLSKKEAVTQAINQFLIWYNEKTN